MCVALISYNTYFDTNNKAKVDIEKFEIFFFHFQSIKKKIINRLNIDHRQFQFAVNNNEFQNYL